MDVINLFNSVVALSFMGSILVLIILLVKSIFRKKLNSYFHYYIWILLIIRLIMPYSIQSSFSIHNVINSAFILNNASDMPNKVVPIKSPGVDMNTSSKTPKENVKKENTGIMMENNKYSPSNIVGIIWLLGSSFMIILVICSHYRITYVIKNPIDYTNQVFNNIFSKCIDIIKVNTTVRLIYTNRLTNPSLYGVMNPTIIIPLKIAKNIGTDEFRYIILHELSHLKRKDVFLNWITTLLQCIYWFNPIILYGLYKMKQDCELACDQHVISYLKDCEYLRYGNTLIKMLEINNDRQWIPGAASLSRNKYEIKRRIKMIAKYKKLSLGGIIFGVALIAVIAVIGLTSSNVKDDILNNTAIKASENINETGTSKIYITLSDNIEGFNNTKVSSQNLSPYLVANEDIKNAVNQLKKLGAVKITVNGEQISEKSDITPDAQFLKINGNKYKSPFIIKGEWNKKISADSLLKDNGVINELKSRGIGVKVETKNNISNLDYKPSIKVEDTKDLNIISNKLFTEYLDYYTKIAANNDFKLRSYKINQITVKNNSNDSFEFMVDFSVQPVNIEAWLTPNGIKSDDWINNKNFFVKASINGNVYSIKNKSTSP